MVKTDAFKQWAVSLIICALGGTLISLLSPRGSMEKTLRAVIGIFVVSAICTPLLKLKKTDTFLPAFVADAVTQTDTSDLELQMKNACRNTIGKVVDDIMNSAGVENYEVEADVDMDEKYCVIIQEIRINIHRTNNGSVAEIEAMAKERLGVPVKIVCE